MTEPTTHALRKLRSHQLRVLGRAAKLLQTITTEETGRPMDAPENEIHPGDLVQIRTTADATFGGMVVRVTKTTAAEIRGYLLCPHRGGNQEAWRRLKYSDIEKCGSLLWAEAEWGKRHPY
jgi:hypothetical protein